VNAVDDVIVNVQEPVATAAASAVDRNLHEEMNALRDKLASCIVLAFHINFYALVIVV